MISIWHENGTSPDPADIKRAVRGYCKPLYANKFDTIKIPWKPQFTEADKKKENLNNLC